MDTDDIQNILLRLGKIEARVEQLEKYINQDDISPELAEELARIVVDKEY